MRIITNTNIIVDDFDYCKNYPKNTFIHFLSHFHADHWFGMTPLWDYSPIYCSEITRKLILNKFPLLDKFITTFPLNELNTIFLNKNPEFRVDIMFFDAHHIPGSVMILFDGFMGTILHTGDFRFRPEMIIENEYLYPLSKSIKQNNKETMPNNEKNGKCSINKDKILKNNEQCSIHIDELIFDNTYCNPMFDFPKSDVVFEMMRQIIDKNKNKHVIIAMGALGKEDICSKIAEYYQTLILISEEKFNQIKALDMRVDLFTINKKESWIEIVSKKHRLKRLKLEEENKNLENIICITTDFLMLEHKDPDGVNFMVPYSLHSNFLEMETFVKSIRPSILRKLVVPFERFAQERNKNFNFLQYYANYVKGLNKNGESSYTLMKKIHTDFFSLSEKFKYWMTEEKQIELRKKLGIADKPDISLRKRKVKSIEEINQLLEMERLFGKKEKGNSLEDIANILKSTHNNQSIKNFIVKRKQKAETKTLGKRIMKMEETLKPKSCLKKSLLDDKTLELLYDFANKQE